MSPAALDLDAPRDQIVDEHMRLASSFTTTPADDIRALVSSGVLEPARRQTPRYGEYRTRRVVLDGFRTLPPFAGAAPS